MTRRPTPTGCLLVTVVVALAVIMGGSANAYWSGAGSGSGTAETGTAQPVTLSTGNPLVDLFPGDSGDVAVTVSNPNSYPVRVDTLELDPSLGTGGFVVDAGHTACSLEALSFATQSNGGTGWTISASGVEALQLSDAVTMDTDAANACQGAVFGVHLTAVGSSAAGFWSAPTTSGQGASAAGTLGSGATPTASVSADSVTVSWIATALADSYTLSRYDATTLAAQPVGAACAGQVASSPCTELGVPAGQWIYTITPRVGTNWTGSDSLPSVAVTVAPTASPLGAAAAFSVLGGIGVTSTGFTTVSGDLGTSPSAAVVGFPDGIVAGTIHAGDATAAQAQADLADAYDAADDCEADTEFAGDNKDRTYFAGVHHTAEAFALTGTMTLDAQHDPSAEFLFQVDAALNTAAASHLNLINGASASNVYWQVLGAAGTGADSTFAGTIMAVGAITLGARSELIGRALTDTQVTLDSNTIRFTAATPPTISITGGSSAVTKDSTPTLTGTSSAATGRPVTVTIAGQTLTTAVQADGTWSATAAVLLAGTYLVAASVRDAAGNAGTVTQSLAVEVNPDPVNLRSLTPFSLLAGLLGVNNVGVLSTTTVAGDLGAKDGTVLGFPIGAIAGDVYELLHPAAVQAQTDLDLAYNDADTRLAHTEFAGDLIGRTFRAGVHHTATALALTGTLTLDGEGNPDAVFIFQVDAALNTAECSHIVLTNGAQASNVYWQVLGAAGTGADSTFVGTILANGAVTLGDGTTLIGRALSTTSVLMSNTTVRFTP